MPLIPWAPVNWQGAPSNPALTAVLAPQGFLLRHMAYLDLLADRVHQMIKEAGPEAPEIIRANMPLDHSFLSLPQDQWAGNLLEEGEMVQARLAEQNLLWPQEVAEPDPAARKTLEQALAEVDLGTWLNLAVPRESHLE